MVVEKELGCYKEFSIPKRIEHIQRAQQYVDEVNKLVGGLATDTGAQVQMRLEQCILRGKKASLDFQEGRVNKDTADKEKKEAVDGIDDALKELQLKDRNRYNANVKHA